jgi:hypothetical protein
MNTIKRDLHCAALRDASTEPASRNRSEVERQLVHPYQTGQAPEVDKLRLSFISDAPAAVGKIGQAPRAKLRTRVRIYRHPYVLRGCNVGQNTIDHPGKDLVSDLWSDEVEDQNIVADPVQQLRPVQDSLRTLLSTIANVSSAATFGTRSPFECKR